MNSSLIRHLLPLRQNLNTCSFVQKRFLALKKRFYKEVSVTSENGNKYEINLDGRKVKTPGGAILTLKSEPLAIAVANEWRMQKDVIRSSEMHLTSLANTATDNPMRVTTELLVTSLIDFMSTDTLCFREDEPEDLKELQNQKWNPVVDWFMNHYDVDLTVTSDIFVSPVPDQTITALNKHLSSYDLPSLMGLNFVTENLKSTILTLALLNQRLSVEEAVSLSKLETEYQTSKWGNVEWAHDLDTLQTRSRVAAGLLFVLLNNEITSTKVKKTIN